MADHPNLDRPDLGRRRSLLRIASATVAASTAIYMAPLMVRIDEAEAKGSKRRHGSRRRAPSRRHHGSRRHRPSRRRY